ncbi:MAG: Csp1 family four helix bundle copper storage protein [Chromatiales bacterium]
MSELHSKTHPETGDAPRRSARRKFLAGATAVGAAALMTGTGRVFATAHHHTWQYSGLMAAAETCMAKGHSCLNHCINTFKGGDTSLASCAVAVQETIAACNALAQLSASNSAHTKAFANACAAVCEDCEKECRKHASKHQSCADCAEACVGLVREVKKAA